MTLDLQHPDIPCFLLSVGPDMPPFYVELFENEAFFDALFEEDAEEGEIKRSALNVLMNWLGSDTQPTFWQAQEALPEADVRDLLCQIVLLTQSAPLPTAD